MTQLNIVKQRLEQDNYISRNWCLRNNITRLGALINQLNKQGFDIEGRYFKTEAGKDYIYTMKKKINSEELNKQLLELLKRIPITWENQVYIKEVNEAIKCKYNTHKESVLKKLSRQHK